MANENLWWFAEYDIFGGASALFFAMASHKRIRRIPF